MQRAIFNAIDIIGNATLLEKTLDMKCHKKPGQCDDGILVCIE
jgi:hypothetical protein